MAGRRSHARGDMRASATKNAARVPSTWLSANSAIVINDACSRMGRNFHATPKSRCMSGHLVDQLRAEAVDAEVLLGPAVQQPVLAHEPDGLVHLGLQLRGALLHGNADEADDVGLADDLRDAGLVLDEIRRRRVGRHRRLDAADLHVREHLGVARVSLEALECAVLLLDRLGRDLAVHAAGDGADGAAFEIARPADVAHARARDDDNRRARIGDRVVEDLLALRRDVDVGEHGVEPSGLQPRQDPFPVQTHEVELHADVFGDEPADLDVVADELVLVVQERHGRQVAAGGGHHVAALHDLRQVGGPRGHRPEDDERQRQEDANASHGYALLCRQSARATRVPSRIASWTRRGEYASPITFRSATVPSSWRESGSWARPPNASTTESASTRASAFENVWRVRTPCGRISTARVIGTGITPRANSRA